VKETLEFKNPLKGKSTAVKILVIIGIALLLVAAVYAATQIWSNDVTVNPLPSPTPTPEPTPTLALSVNTTTPYVGENIELTATLSNGADGVTVDFYRNNVLMGSNITVSGVCTYIAPITNENQKIYNATCTV
jgi:hypothetical protein